LNGNSSISTVYNSCISRLNRPIIHACARYRVWESTFFLAGHSVVLEYIEVIVDDADGNGNGKLDPGETANLLITVGNIGSADAYDVSGDLASNNPLVVINTPTMDYGEMIAMGEGTEAFSVSPDILTSPHSL